jgi:hypothetical protein
MRYAGGPGRVLGFLLIALMIVAIATLLVGYGVPVGIGALAGLLLGIFAGLLGTMWLTRSGGRSINLAGMAWSSGDVSPEASAVLATQMRELHEILEIDLGPIRSILPVLETVEAGGLEVQLVTVDLHEAGTALTVDVRVLPGALHPQFIAQVSMTDDVGTRYRASGQTQGGGSNRARYSIAVIPALPATARELVVRIDAFVDPFRDATQATVGPWQFRVALPAPGG